MIELAFFVVVHICDGGLDLHIVFTNAHIGHVVLEFDVAVETYGSLIFVR